MREGGAEAFSALFLSLAHCYKGWAALQEYMRLVLSSLSTTIRPESRGDAPYRITKFLRYVSGYGGHYETEYRMAP